MATQPADRIAEAPITKDKLLKDMSEWLATGDYEEVIHWFLDKHGDNEEIVKDLYDSMLCALGEIYG
jgi:hypothetical protein